MLIIGFDFDMTLVDSSLGILETTKAVLSEIITPEKIAELPLESALGNSISNLFKPFLPEDLHSNAISRYLELYPIQGIKNSVMLVGAKDLISTCSHLNLRTVLVSAKTHSNLELMLDWHQLSFNRVYGGAHGKEKGRHLKNELVDIYIGDQEADVEASLFAGAISVIIRNKYNTDLDTWGHKPDLIFNNLIEAISYIQDFNLLVSKWT